MSGRGQFRPARQLALVCAVGLCSCASVTPWADHPVAAATSQASQPTPVGSSATSLAAAADAVPVPMSIALLNELTPAELKPDWQPTPVTAAGSVAEGQRVESATSQVNGAGERVADVGGTSPAGGVAVGTADGVFTGSGSTGTYAGVGGVTAAFGHGISGGGSGDGSGGAAGGGGRSVAALARRSVLTGSSSLIAMPAAGLAPAAGPITPAAATPVPSAVLAGPALAGVALLARLARRRPAVA